MGGAGRVNAGAWKPVRQELGRWRARGLTARFWMRDDDACEVTPQLERLAALARRRDFKIGLAVIPSRLTDTLVRSLEADDASFLPMCHGWSHTNYGSVEKPGEFGPDRPLAEAEADCRRAFERFAACFGAHPAIFVPPFGCITKDVEATLGDVGFAALSNGPTLTLARMARLHAKFEVLPPNPFWALPARPLDVHVDPIDWRRKTAHTPEHIAAELLGELRLRRKGYIPSSNPIGLLTHHLVHDEAIWSVCDELLDVLQNEPAVAFADLEELFARNTPSPSAADEVSTPAAAAADKV
jgi:peptidoglycan/xylan/chitin deacetylase (PgdA/CDA1 family)